MMKKQVIVREVFAGNLKEEFALINSVIMEFPFVSMDTEFPGTIFKQDKVIIQEGNPHVNYQFMKSNVDALKIIQLGLTLADSNGNLPDFGSSCCYIWEFNFRDFDIEKDYYDKESIELLKRQGIDFAKNKEQGIDSRKFAMMASSSGLVFNRFGGLNWLTFHGSYDFGFFVKILSQQPLPFDLHSFTGQLVYYFGYKIFDIKHTFRFLGLHGGLEKVSKTLDVAREAGLSHQAGSDSLLTLQCFMHLKNSKVFDCNQRNRGLLPALALYGLVSSSTPPNAAAALVSIPPYAAAALVSRPPYAAASALVSRPPYAAAARISTPPYAASSTVLVSRFQHGHMVPAMASDKLV